MLASMELGEGPVVVFLAGFGLDHRIWDGQIEHLSGTHRVVCVDLLGTGSSPKPRTGYATGLQAHLVVETLRTRGIDEFAVVGHSFGGLVACAVAAAFPKSVTQLVLVGSNGVRAGRNDVFPFGPPGDRMRSALTNAERTDRLTSRRNTLAAGFASPPSDAVLDHLFTIFTDMPSWSAIPTFDAMYDTDQIDAIERLSMPVAQIVGASDRVHPVDGARWLQSRLKSELEVVPDAGHYLMFEAPEALNAFLGRVLTSAPTPSSEARPATS